MDNKTFIASFAAQETQRINQQLKDMIERGHTPTEEEKNAIIADIEATLERIKNAFSNVDLSKGPNDQRS